MSPLFDVDYKGAGCPLASHRNKSIIYAIKPPFLLCSTSALPYFLFCLPQLILVLTNIALREIQMNPGHNVLFLTEAYFTCPEP